MFWFFCHCLYVSFTVQDQSHFGWQSTNPSPHPKVHCSCCAHAVLWPQSTPPPPKPKAPSTFSFCRCARHSVQLVQQAFPSCMQVCGWFLELHGFRNMDRLKGTETCEMRFAKLDSSDLKFALWEGRRFTGYLCNLSCDIVVDWNTVCLLHFGESKR
jgi:hypothetical protein